MDHHRRRRFMDESLEPVSRIIRCRQLCMMAPDCLSEVVNALALKTLDFIDPQTSERLGPHSMIARGQY